MKILAIDTSTAAMGIALLDDQKVYAEFTTNLKKNHSIRLMPVVDQLFEEVGWQPRDIGLIAVAKGPGSYTGVRIGVTTAKTLSFTLGVPLIGVSTLEALAYGSHRFSGVISPLIDARRDQAYVGLYQMIDGVWSNPEEDRIILVSDWVKIINKYNEEVLFVGDDVQAHQETLSQLGDKATFSSLAFNSSKPSIIGYLAKVMYENGKLDNVFDFAPAYLQIVEAEAKLIEKNKQ